MPTLDATLDGLKQAFEDFMAHEAEFAIAEATRDQDAHKRLWVVLYGDGRYALQHRFEAESAPESRREPHDLGQIAFPIEPLLPSERDSAHLENSRFDRPIETISKAYKRAMHARFDR
jgi:hypothetical protein